MTVAPGPGAEIRVEGVAVSPGIAFGPLRVDLRRFSRPPSHPVAPQRIEGELTRFRAAVERTREQISADRDRLATRTGGETAGIFDAHLQILDDGELLRRVEKRISEAGRNVESVFYDIVSTFIERLREAENSFFRERATDIEDVAGRVIANLSGTDPESESAAAEDHILFAHDLTPFTASRMDHRRALGFATVLGGFTSHAAIMARALQIPGVVGLHLPEAELERATTTALLDGYEGLLIINPSSETLKAYRALAKAKEERVGGLEHLRHRLALTADGLHIILSANIEFGSELESVRELGAEGIGLYRTEFFFFESGAPPDEDKQTANYARFAEVMQQGGVIIRTLDVGGDKLHPDLAEREPNPFLGCRGIRLSLTEPAILKTQIRAILRASTAGKIRLMFPMISGMEELRAALALLQECREELRREGHAFDENLEAGCMIEVPSAALQADHIAREVDFLSVGTNDLVQYTIAVDRGNEHVAHLYQPGHPAVLRLLKKTVDAAHTNGIWAGICGEMAGERLFTPLLLGLGFDEFSVSPSQLLEVKEAISLLDSNQCRDFAEELLRYDTPEAVMAACASWAKVHFANSVIP